MERGFQLLSGAAFVSCLAIASSASACSCAVGDSFEDISVKADTIIQARVLEHVFLGDALRPNGIPTAMRVEILEQVKGEVEDKQILIGGDNGMLCRPYVSQFPVDTEWLFAIGPDFHSSENEWAISVCGKHWKRLSPVMSEEAISENKCRKNGWRGIVQALSHWFAKPNAISGVKLGPGDRQSLTASH